MEINIWRAPTDNDMYIRQEWSDAGYDRVIPRAKNFRWQQKDGYIEVSTHVSLGAIYRQNILEAELIWYLEADGRLSLSFKAKRCMAMPWLPRLGLRIFLPQSVDTAEYFGCGPFESYVDKHHASMLGRYRCSAEENFEHYLRPQENSSHYDCTELSVCSSDSGFSFCADKPFSFSFCCYTQEEICAKKHDFELEKSPDNVLCLDFFHSGVGSNSCGPELDEKYRLDEECFESFVQLSLI